MPRGESLSEPKSALKDDEPEIILRGIGIILTAPACSTDTMKATTGDVIPKQGQNDLKETAFPD